jgi:hypothetical protein
LLLPKVSFDETPFDRIRIHPESKISQEQDLTFRVCWLGSWLLEYESPLRERWKLFAQHSALSGEDIRRSMDVIMSDPRGGKLKIAQATDVKPAQLYRHHLKQALISIVVFIGLLVMGVLIAAIDYSDQIKAAWRWMVG